MDLKRIERPGIVAYRFKCDDCGDIVIHAVKGITTGYATTASGQHLCFRCCGKRDRETMIQTGSSRSLPLYLSVKRLGPAVGMASWIPSIIRQGDYWVRASVTNWPGTLVFPVTGLQRNSKGHNWGLMRTDFWFNGPDGHVWHGYQIGHNSEIAHCRRTKQLVCRYPAA